MITFNGCKKEEVIIDDGIKPNQSVSELKVYIPTDFNYELNLKGMGYTENDRKVFSKGNREDNNDVIYIDIIKTYSPMEFKNYINELNKSFEEEDIKYTIKDQTKIYARENYITISNEIEIVNYEYLVNINGYVYSITIKGPKVKEDEIKSLVNQIYDSIEK